MTLREPPIPLQERRTLREHLLEAFAARDIPLPNLTPVQNHLDTRVARVEWDARVWPCTKHKNILFWFNLDDQYAVAWNHNTDPGRTPRFLIGEYPAT